MSVAPPCGRTVAPSGGGALFALQGTYAREPQPLETAGGIAQALPLLGTAPFLLVNADIYCEIAFRPLLAFQLGGNLAHLLLGANPPHRPQGAFSLNAASVGHEGAPRHTYARVALISPQPVRPVRRADRTPLA